MRDEPYGRLDVGGRADRLSPAPPPHQLLGTVRMAPDGLGEARVDTCADMDPCRAEYRRIQGAYPGLAGGFLILGFDGREAVYVEDAFSGDIIEAADDVATMKRIWEALRVEALPGKQSVDLLAEVAKQWT
ncbi:MAG: Scr1 family TA system antitoxin-like transcriptional regulator [Actinoallomurus sp.]